MTIYHLETSPSGIRNEIEAAVSILRGHTAYNLSWGEIVRDETKQIICTALATALKAVPQLPFKPVSDETLVETFRDLWTEYDQLAEALSSFTDYAEVVRRCLFRHIALEFAIRAAAMAEIFGDPPETEDVPIWSKHAELKKYLKKRIEIFDSQEEAGVAMSRSRNEVSRWLNQLDIPPYGALRIWDEKLESDPKFTIRFGKHHLWRLYVGRRIFVSLRGVIPKDLIDELCRMYCRAKLRIQTHLSSRKVPEYNKSLMLRHLVRFARISDPGLAMDLRMAATDPIWRRHIEPFCQVEGMPTLHISALCEMYSSAAFGIEQAAKQFGLPLPKMFDDALRYSFAKTDSGDGPIADMLRLVEDAQRQDNQGDIAASAEAVGKFVERHPQSSGGWGALGRYRQQQGRFKEAEHCFRNAMLLNPAFLDHRTDLAFLLTKTGNGSLALEELEKCNPDQKQTVQWKFVCGRALLVTRRPAEAKRMLVDCIEEPYKFGAALIWMAEACELLGEDGKEYRKRAAELGIKD